jgi:hypothetical protein
VTFLRRHSLNIGFLILAAAVFYATARPVQVETVQVVTVPRAPAACLAALEAAEAMLDDTYEVVAGSLDVVETVSVAVADLRESGVLSEGVVDDLGVGRVRVDEASARVQSGRFVWEAQACRDAIDFVEVTGE